MTKVEIANTTDTLGAEGSDSRLFHSTLVVRRLSFSVTERSGTTKGGDVTSWTRVFSDVGTQ